MWPIESGNTYWDVLTEMTDKANNRLELTETAAGEFLIDVCNKTYIDTLAPPYYIDWDDVYDLSGRLQFASLMGNVRALGKPTSYRALANTFTSRGKGQASATDYQNAYWAEDEQSVIDYGRFEDGQTAFGGADNAPSLTEKATQFLNRYGIPIETWALDIAYSPPGLKPILDWGRYTKVMVSDAKIAPTPTVLECVGWVGRCDGPGMEPQTEVHVGMPMLDWNGRIQQGVARFGGYSGGGIAVRKGSY
jgi:hypothetical protein